MLRDVWSILPPELAIQIAQHNADDVETLRAMCLVSSAMRNVAIEQLFSVLCFSREEDFLCWWDLLQRTPMLGRAVRKVQISIPGEPYLLSPLPTVVEVEWKNRLNTWRVDVALAYMEQLFPNATRLSFIGMRFKDPAELTTILRTCKPLKGLTMTASDFRLHGDTDAPLEMVDFSKLEELTFTCSGGYQDHRNVLVQLFRASPPTELKVLNLLSEHGKHAPCSVSTILALLRLAASSLTHLTIYPIFTDHDILYDGLKDLPTLTALRSLTVWLAPFVHNAPQAESFFAALPPLPRVTTLKLLIRVQGTHADYKPHYLAFFSSRPMEFKRPALERRFPELQAMVVGFYASRDSAMHDAEQGAQRYRALMEDRLMKRFQEMSARVEGLIQVEWLDLEYRKVDIIDRGEVEVVVAALPTKRTHKRDSLLRTVSTKLFTKFRW
ncbi:hypothetical protein C8F01DRAFT_1157177 [Mycena amicta]|nr:hypothetical protein C8F01DRAFT_1157177 [Mycena amicta]